MAPNLQPNVGSRVFALSPRELECLLWVSRGKSSGDIGAILGLSPRTVDSYLEKVCSKLRVRTRISDMITVQVRNHDPILSGKLAYRV